MKTIDHDIDVANVKLDAHKEEIIKGCIEQLQGVLNDLVHKKHKHRRLRTEC